MQSLRRDDRPRGRKPQRHSILEGATVNQTPEHEPTQPGIYRVPEFDFAAFMGGFRDQMAKLEEQAQPVRRLIDATSIRVESEGGEVALTVTVGGDLVGVEFLPAAEDTDPAELAATIAATYDRAAETARERSPEVLGAFLDLQSQTMARAHEMLKQAQVRRAESSTES
jgi:DNA-binding protein YbaB